jgi:hypothetical protein
MINKNRAQNAAKATGRGLGFAGLALLAGFAAISEEAEKQRKIQEHTDALKALQPDCDIMFVHKA